MKLSEAIRLGAMMKPQGFCELLNDKGGTCAIGAAGDAFGKISYTAIEKMYPFIIAERQPDCPMCGVCGSRIDIEGIIFHLNDAHRWTREDIADWVETIENQQVETAVEPERIEA